MLVRRDSRECFVIVMKFVFCLLTARAWRPIANKKSPPLRSVRNQEAV